MNSELIERLEGCVVGDFSNHEAVNALISRAVKALRDQQETKTALTKQAMEQQLEITELQTRIESLESALNDLWGHYGNREWFEWKYPEHRDLIESCKPDIRTVKDG